MQQITIFVIDCFKKSSAAVCLRQKKKKSFSLRIHFNISPEHNQVSSFTWRLINIPIWVGETKESFGLLDFSKGNLVSCDILIEVINAFNFLESNRFSEIPY